MVSENQLDNISGKGSRLHGAREADEMYDNIVDSSLTQNAVSDDFRQREAAVSAGVGENSSGWEGRDYRGLVRLYCAEA